jgi:glucokinase
MQARAAFEAGAHAIIVGSAITRPDLIARSFIEATDGCDPARAAAIGIDLGSTNTKFGVVCRDGALLWQDCRPTPALDGRDALLNHLGRIVERCRTAAHERNASPCGVGIATGGWVDPLEGRVIYATGNLPGWSGTDIRAGLEQQSGLPVAVENDANAMAVAEKRFGLAKTVSNFVSVTLGTGVGGGCFVGGRLNRGANYLGNAIGHIVVEPGGMECNCGQRGCLEVYANAAALVRYAGGAFTSAAQVSFAAKRGEAVAEEAIRTYVGYLGRGLAIVANLLDPELILLSGGLAETSDTLIDQVERTMARLVVGWPCRRIRLARSEVARSGGVLGASAVVLDRLNGRARTSLG